MCSRQFFQCIPISSLASKTNTRPLGEVTLSSTNRFKGIKNIKDVTHSKRQAEFFRQNKNLKGGYGRCHTSTHAHNSIPVTVTYSELIGS